MRYYPVSLDIEGKPCLVVGGGAVGTRKVKGLVRCGAHVTVVSPFFSEALTAMEGTESVSLKARAYQPSDVDGVFLAIVATDDLDLNRRVGEDAHRVHALCNVADAPAACDFVLPAIVERGDMTLSVSTSGKSPAFAKWMRRRLAEDFGEEYGVFLALMGRVREKMLAVSHDPDAHKPLFEALIASDLLALVASGERGEVDALLTRILGEGYTCDTLGVHL